MALGEDDAGPGNLRRQPEGVQLRSWGNETGSKGKGLVEPEKGQESHQVDALSTLGYRHLLSTYGVQGTQVIVPHSSESPPVASFLCLE